MLVITRSIKSTILGISASISPRVVTAAVPILIPEVTKGDLSHAIDVIHDRFDKIEVKLEKISAAMPRTRKMSDTQ